PYPHQRGSGQVVVAVDVHDTNIDTESPFVAGPSDTVPKLFVAVAEEADERGQVVGAVDVDDTNIDTESPFVAGPSDTVPKLFVAVAEEADERCGSPGSLPDEAYNLIRDEVAGVQAKLAPTINCTDGTGSSTHEVRCSPNGVGSSTVSSFGEVSTPSTSGRSDVSGSKRAVGASLNAGYSTPSQPVRRGPTPTPPSAGSGGSIGMSSLSILTPSASTLESSVQEFVSNLSLASTTVFLHKTELV
ncbi:hypothetical protein HDU96_005260, partial [Phlyctochytrium bullatum]